MRRKKGGAAVAKCDVEQNNLNTALVTQGAAATALLVANNAVVAAMVGLANANANFATAQANVAAASAALNACLAG
jgi:hypothetical protein